MLRLIAAIAAEPAADVLAPIVGPAPFGDEEDELEAVLQEWEEGYRCSGQNSLLQLWIIERSGYHLPNESQSNTYVTFNRSIKLLSASSPCTDRHSSCLRTTGRHFTFRLDMAFHAEVRILSKGYSNWRIAEWT